MSSAVTDARAETRTAAADRSSASLYPQVKVEKVEYRKSIEQEQRPGGGIPRGGAVDVPVGGDGRGGW